MSSPEKSVPEIEIGLIGREGMTGTTLIMGDDRAAHSAVVQVPGQSYRIAAAPFRQALASSPTLHGLLLRFVQSFMAQAMHTAIAHGRAKVEQLIARWLIMAHDRIDGSELTLTHELIALMLGVRRSSVTVTL